LAEERLSALNECNVSAADCRLSTVYQPQVRRVLRCKHKEYRFVVLRLIIQLIILAVHCAIFARPNFG